MATKITTKVIAYHDKEIRFSSSDFNPCTGIINAHQIIELFEFRYWEGGVLSAKKIHSYLIDRPLKGIAENLRSFAKRITKEHASSSEFYGKDRVEDGINFFMKGRPKVTFVG